MPFKPCGIMLLLHFIAAASSPGYSLYLTPYIFCAQNLYNIYIEYIEYGIICSMTEDEILKPAERGNPQRQSKMEKKQKNLYLSAQARRLLSAISLSMGISETAVVELLIREKAARENITVPATVHAGEELR